MAYWNLPVFPPRPTFDPAAPDAALAHLQAYLERRPPASGLNKRFFQRVMGALAMLRHPLTLPAPVHAATGAEGWTALCLDLATHGLLIGRGEW